MSKDEIFLIDYEDHLKFGCPSCGCCNGHDFISMKGITFWVCETCEKEALVQIYEMPEAFSLVEQDNIINALDRHPRGLRPCDGCQSGADAQVITTGTFSTPGCFVAGGTSEERNCLVIRAKCNFAAQKIIRMFEAGAIKDGSEYIIIGANREYQPNLHSLMLQIIRTGRIDTNTIIQAQRMSHAEA